MNVYLDTEFTGLHKTTSLISIGLISEDGKTFYAENREYNQAQVDQWIKDNVIAHTSYLKLSGNLEIASISMDTYHNAGRLSMTIVGVKELKQGILPIIS